MGQVIKLDTADFTYDQSKMQLVVTDGGKSEIYQIDKKPDAKSILVQAGRGDLLQSLSLESVLTNLDICADLLYLAYNGVAPAAGTGLQGQVQKIQIDLVDLCGTCAISMREFREHSGRVVSLTMDGFTMLLRGKEEPALTLLQSCADTAKKMSDEAGTLAKRFGDISNDTKTTLLEAIKARGLAKDKADELLREINKMTADKKFQESLEKTVTEDLTKADAHYQEVREDLNTADKRALALGIASAAMHAVGAGVAMYAGVQNPVPAIVSRASTAAASGAAKDAAKDAEDESKKKAEAEVANAKKTLKEDRETAEKAKEKATKKKGEVEKKKKEAEKAAEDAKEKPNSKAAKSKVAAAEAEVEEAEEEKEAAVKEATEADKKVQASEKALLAAQQALSAAANQLSKMGEQSADVATQLRQEKRDAYQNIINLQKQKRDALAELAKLTEQITNTKTEKGVSETSIASLHLAVGALKQVQSALLEAKYFWDNMVRYCSSLADPEFKTRVKAVSVLKIEERIAYYNEPKFVAGAIIYVARWRALELVCEEYREAADKVRVKANKLIVENPNLAESNALAPQLAQSIGARLGADISKVAAKVDRLEVEKAVV